MKSHHYLTNAATNQQEAIISTTGLERDHDEIIVSANRKSTSDKKLTDAERIRCCAIPAATFSGITILSENCPTDPLSALLQSKLQDIANQRLREFIAETADSVRSIPLNLFSLPALLAWDAETSAARGSISFSKEEVLEWFNKSATKQQLAQRLPAEGLEFISKRFSALAAKNHGLAKEADALKLLSLIAPVDATSETGSAVVARINAIATSLRAKADSNTWSMDSI